jgi:methionyl aminopeptidase
MFKAARGRMQSLLQTIISKLAAMTAHPGITGLDLDAFAKAAIEEAGAQPAFLGFNGFPNTLCVSLNETVVHGVPNNKPFEDGDVVKLDLGLVKDGQFDDGATTVIIGKAGKIAQKLIKATQEALELGCTMAQPGYTTNDIGRVIHMTAVKHGFLPVSGYGGHGIGTELHMDPFVPNYSIQHPVVILVEGQRLAIEPMFSSKGPDTFIGPDGFSVILKKGIAAHFERTVTVQKLAPGSHQS